jgi:hypothetical protein
MMCAAMDNPASYEIHAKKLSAAEINLESCATAYGQNIMSETPIRQWCRMFEDWRTNVHDEERSGRPSIALTKICESQLFRISERLCEFPQSLGTLL